MPIDLPAIVSTVPDWSRKTPTEIRAYLAGETTEPVTTDYTVAMLESALGTPATQLVTGTLRAAAKLDARLEAAWIAMSVQGIQLYTVERQDAIRQLAVAGNWTDSVRDQVLALGRRPTTRWALLSEDEIPSVEEFESAKSVALINEAKSETAGKIREWLEAAHSLSNAGVVWSEIDGRTLADLQAAVEDLP